MTESQKKRRKQNRPNKYRSIRLMLKEAERGNLEAQYYVGACFATGNWDGPKDEAETVRWYIKAAEAGHAMSQYDLGFMFLLGEGTEEDIQKELWWIEQAASKGGA
jgi:uncharacterized protein